MKMHPRLVRALTQTHTNPIIMTLKLAVIMLPYICIYMLTRSQSSKQSLSSRAYTNSSTYTHMHAAHFHANTDSGSPTHTSLLLLYTHTTVQIMAQGGIKLQ